MARHLGDVVRAYREKWVNPRDPADTGMSMNRLANRSGVALSLISRLEAHKHDYMTEDNLRKIAQALNVTLRDLRAETLDGEVPENELSLEEWLERDRTLTPQQRQVVLDVYRGLARIE